MTDKRTAGIGQTAARQWGLVSVTQLGRLGCDHDNIGYRRRAGELIQVRREVDRVRGAPHCWEQVVLAAALAAGDEAVVSHATAAAVWDLRHSDRTTAGLHVTAPFRIRRDGVTGHRCRLTPAERTVHRNIPVTTPERTIVDLADALSPQQLSECVDDALRRRLIRLERLRSVVTAAATPRSGRRLLAPIHQILADRIAGYRPGDSDWEQEMDRQWDRLGLPTGASPIPGHGRRPVLSHRSGYPRAQDRGGMGRIRHPRHPVWFRPQQHQASRPHGRGLAHDRLHVPLGPGSDRPGRQTGGRGTRRPRPVNRPPRSGGPRSGAPRGQAPRGQAHQKPQAPCDVRRHRSQASMNGSRSPSRTPSTLPVSWPVRWSLTFW